MTELALFFRDGGIFMYFILSVSIVGVAITVERAIHLVFKYSIDGDALWKRVSKSVMENDVGKAKSFCSGSEAPLAVIYHKALENYGKTEREIQNAVDEASLDVIPKVDKRIPYLAMIANVSTLLGLLGTIQGLVQAFQAVGSADPSQKAAMLASGISIALYTTAFGLIVAIPMLVAYSLLQSKAHRIIDDIDEFSVRLMNLLIRKWSERRGDA